MNLDNEQSLANYVSRIMIEKKLTSYEIEQRSNKQINQSYVVKIKNNNITNVSPVKLKALAKGLGVSEEEIFSIIRGKLPDLSNLANEQLENLIRKFGQLPMSKRIYAQALIDLLNREFERLLNEGQ